MSFNVKMRTFLPIWAANMMGSMMEKSAKRKGAKPMMTTFSVYNLARNNVFDSTKAMRELGYRTRSYQETMHDEIAWLIAEGKIKGGERIKRDEIAEGAAAAVPAHS